LPTVADLRERRLELLRANLRDALETGGHDRLRGVVEPLTEEFDVVDIALAAVSLIEGAEARDEDEVELAQASFQAPGPGPGAGRRPGGSNGRRSGVPSFPRAGGADGGGRAPGRPGGPGGGVGPGARTPRGPEADGWQQLWIGGGRRAGLRPGDLVGAIANEAGVPGSVVGAIQLFDDFALVDVQGQVADAVEHALRNATIRGQKLPVRRERAPSRR
jgi:ATP-dependent RNA helicase DeaD